MSYNQQLIVTAWRRVVLFKGSSDCALSGGDCFNPHLPITLPINESNRNPSCVCVCVRVEQTDPQGNPVSMTVPHVQLINPENQIVEVSDVYITLAATVIKTVKQATTML